ncbi:MAG: ParB/RepB/Spo0J family partition protein [Chloroflexia bacterium]|nr:ParB/RepB/Spo0J family partition protein [Chloroflexia bacterium]
MTARMIYVSLDRIRDNPWQMRLQIDQEYVVSLAADIQARGLLQMPAGRVVDENDQPLPPYNLDFSEGLPDKLYLQLAFGHNRVAAFRHLSQKDGDTWSSIPIQIQDLSDEQIALAAWAENARRKDLSPIEEAMAIQQWMEDFGWSQREIADKIGLARSTIANKLRLLELPEEIQDQVKGGEIPERSAIALKGYYDLPEPIKASVANDRYVRNILQDPTSYTSEDIRKAIGNAIDQRSGDLLEEPEPCPFCGCPIIRVVQLTDFYANCTRCDSFGPAAKTRPDSISRWNSRKVGIVA